jgi:DNA polymerase-3 subunit beta
LRFTVTKDQLRALLSAVNPAVPSRSTLPSLQHVLLEADGDMLRGTATDLDMVIRTQVQARDVVPGSLCAPVATLKQIADKLPVGDVVIEVTNGDFQIRAGRARFTVKGLPVDQFPHLKWPSFADAWTVPASDLFCGIESVIFAVSDEETRPILNGVYWHIRDGEMRMVATNGHRLALAGVRAPQGAAEVLKGADLIVHPRSLGTARALFAGAHTVEVARTPDHLAFRAGDSVVVTRLIEGPYPNYEQVLPKDLDREVIGGVVQLRQATERVGILASEQTHRVVFTMSNGAALRISTGTPDRGDADEEVPVQYEGEPLEIGFNASYIGDILKRVDADQVRWTFGGPERATMLEPVDQKGGVRTRFLLMPLRATG